jgi:preprotein translocase subunit YajC
MMESFTYFLTALLPLAQGDESAVTPQPTGSPFPPIWLLVIPFVLLWLMMFQDRKKKVDPRLAALKKNDRIVTIGGIHGVVVQASADSEEVVVRVDENTGTRLRLNRSAIGQVVEGAVEAEKPQ